MKTPIQGKIEAALRRTRAKNWVQALSTRGVPEVRAAAMSRVRASMIKPDLKPEDVMAKAAAARKLLRRG